MSAQHGAHAFPKRLVQGKGRERTRHKSKKQASDHGESTMEGARLSSEGRGRESDRGKLCEADRVKQKEG